MSIALQKAAGAILFALILAVGVGMLGDLVVPQRPATEPGKPAGKEEAAAPGAEAAGQPQPEQSLPALLASASAEKGQAVAKKCAACHTFDEGAGPKVGPNLHGVVGADIASKPGFAYSQALTSKPGEWTYDELDAFLTKPGGWASGTKMTFAGLSDPKDRADVIAYLRSLSPNAPPLPQAAAKAEAGKPAEQAPAEKAPAGQAAAAPEAKPAPGSEEPAKQPETPKEEAAQPSQQAAAGTAAPPGGAAGGGLNAMIKQASVEAGQKAAKVCTSCHTFNEGGGNRVGPNLHGVVGRDIASSEYRYSTALGGKEGHWTYENLDAFLTSPAGWAPGTKMTFAGVKEPEQRAAIIAYLRSLSPDAPPL